MTITTLQSTVNRKISDVESKIRAARIKALEVILDDEHKKAIAEKVENIADFSSWSSHPNCWYTWSTSEIVHDSYESNDGGLRYDSYTVSDHYYDKKKDFWKHTDLEKITCEEVELLLKELDDYRQSEEYQEHLKEQSLIEHYRFRDTVGDFWYGCASSREEKTQKLNTDHFPLNLKHRNQALCWHQIKETQVGCRWWVQYSKDSNWTVLEKGTLEWAIICKYFDDLQSKPTNKAVSEATNESSESSSSLGSMFADVFAQFK